jgi:hypothetical protein
MIRDPHEIQVISNEKHSPDKLADRRQDVNGVGWLSWRIKRNLDIGGKRRFNVDVRAGNNEEIVF